MQIVSGGSKFDSGGRAVAAAIGVFDGVHIGHQRVISTAVADAQRNAGVSVVVTFDVHPASVLAPDRAPKLIQPLQQRLREIGKLGVDAVIVQEFTREFSALLPEEFIERLTAQVHPLRAIAVGESFSFGHKRSGNVAALEKWSAAHGYSVHGVPPVHFKGQPVSSTRIRGAIRDGNLPLLRELLGRPYSIRSVVQRGDQLGGKLGFPTANLDVSALELPPFGVYAGEALLPTHSARAVANIGVRPSIAAEPSPRLEIHLLDFKGDLYEQEIEFIPSRQLRGEQKFATLPELRKQIALDVANARLG